MSTERALSFLPVPSRSGKPRNVGLTIARDDGIGYETAVSFMEAVAQYIDWMKIRHFFMLNATTAEDDFTRRKIKLYRDHDIEVFPGGIVFEIAHLSRETGRYFEAIAAYGCSAVEISENMIELDDEARRESLRLAKNAGLKTLFEVGEKYPSSAMALDELVDEIKRVLDWGATKVIVERSYTDMLLGVDGKLPTSKYVVDLVHAVGLEHLTFEAETPAHQAWFIRTFGPDVNLGPNIAPELICKLEPTRVALSRDTGYTFVTDLAASRTISA